MIRCGKCYSRTVVPKVNFEVQWYGRSDEAHAEVPVALPYAPEWRCSACNSSIRSPLMRHLSQPKIVSRVPDYRGVLDFDLYAGIGLAEERCIDEIREELLQRADG
jgi:hypothetical protein